MPQYTQHYSPKWQTLPELKNWVCPSESGPGKAYCKLCKCDINAKLCDLKAHANTQKHKKYCNPYLPPMTQLTLDTSYQNGRD